MNVHTLTNNATLANGRLGRDAFQASTRLQNVNMQELLC